MSLLALLPPRNTPCPCAVGRDAPGAVFIRISDLFFICRQPPIRDLYVVCGACVCHLSITPETHRSIQNYRLALGRRMAGMRGEQA